jgi:hypothetical protein
MLAHASVQVQKHAAARLLDRALAELQLRSMRPSTPRSGTGRSTGRVSI